MDYSLDVFLTHYRPLSAGPPLSSLGKHARIPRESAGGIQRMQKRCPPNCQNAAEYISILLSPKKNPIANRRRKTERS